jgi:sugar phosphate isomerase/epimerase
MSIPIFYSRRQFIKTSVAGSLAVRALGQTKLATQVGGMGIGLQTYSLRGLRVEALIPAMQEIGIGICELWAAQVEPLREEVPDIWKWRATVSLDFFKDVRRQFNQAGIEIASYNPSLVNRGPRGAPPPPPPSEDQLDRIFVMTKALGATSLNSSVPPQIAPTIASLADKHKMIVGNYLQDADTLKLSRYFRYDIDVGDYTKAGNDALKFVKDNYEQISDIHVKDCIFKGASVPFGQGDSHLKEVLLFLKEKKANVRANIDCDYPGTGTSVDEVKKCLEYVQMILA